jgi:HAMP domain-containing protein
MKENRMDHESRRLGLKWKIGGIFAGVTLISGLLVIAAVTHLVKSAARDQLYQRVGVIANNLSDGAAGLILAKNHLALHALTRKYTLLNGVAYAFVEDATGEVVAHTFGSFPEELRRERPGVTRYTASQRQLSFSGKPVYETSLPVLEGQAGSVHVGFWQAAIDEEIGRALFPLIAIVAIISLVAALVALPLAHWIVRPIVGLLEVADKVTMGDLETAVSGKCVKSRDEIGDLARSLERMRSSLKAAMLRLGRETA